MFAYSLLARLLGFRGRVPVLLGLPVDLLETALGCLSVRDIKSARCACRAWSSRRGRCPVSSSWPPDPVIHRSSVQHLRLEHLRLENLPVKWAATDRLQTVEIDWTFHNGLSTLLKLSCLTSLILHGAKDLHDTTASVACPLEKLVLSGCRNMCLDFMDQLSRLTSLGLWHCLDLVPADVPDKTRARLQQLHLRNVRGRPGLFSLQEFASLRDLRFDGTDLHCARLLHTMIATFNIVRVDTNINAARFETLKVYAPVCNLFRSSQVVSLDVSYDEWLAQGGPKSSLRELVIRGYTGDGDCLVESCVNLQKLRVEGGRMLGFELPASLQHLELVGLRPPAGLDVRTLYLETGVFASLTVAQQARLKTSVRNLYVVPSLALDWNRGFSSFFG